MVVGRCLLICAFCRDCDNKHDCPSVEAGFRVTRCTSFVPIRYGDPSGSVDGDLDCQEEWFDDGEY